MAERDSERQQRKAQLIAELSAARAGVNRDLGRVSVPVRQALGAPARVKTSVRKNAWKWLVGSLVVGIVAGKILRPKRCREDSETRSGGIGRSLVRATGSTAIKLAKPWLVKLIRARVEGLVANSLQQRTEELHSEADTL